MEAVLADNDPIGEGMFAVCVEQFGLGTGLEVTSVLSYPEQGFATNGGRPIADDVKGAYTRSLPPFGEK